MTRRSLIVPLSAVFTVTLGAMGAAQMPHPAGAPGGPARLNRMAANSAVAQNPPSRSNDRQVGQLLTRTKKSADRFRTSLDNAVNRSPINGSREEDAINQSV